jgi:glycyl-tRNA synthetase
MLELGCTNLTPEIVLKASGHVDKFTDYMVKDEKTGAFYRADKIVQEFIEKVLLKNDTSNKKLKQEEVDKLKYIHQNVDKWEEKEIDDAIAELKVKSPDGNGLTKSSKFNLMFQNQIGPDKGSIGYLRPETAQGQFVNFKKLLEYNGGKLPFASATIGLGFRNEISPRSGLLRVREFSLAEIEHFVDPQQKQHKKFKLVKDMILPLWTAEDQVTGKGIQTELTLGKAVEERIIDNETLAYYLARTYQFLITIGVRTDAVRFRQHTQKEMAHYASDCWDAEIETSYGWIEVVGHADRTCFDLMNHSKYSKIDHYAARLLKQPIVHKKIRIEANKANLYKTYKDKMKAITELIDNMDDVSKERYCEEFEKNGKTNLEVGSETIEIGGDLISFKRYEETQTEEKYVPGVIEPAFGIGRIVYCVMEHCFKIRQEDSKRTYFIFPPLVSPYKVSILPLISNDEMNKFIEPLSKQSFIKYFFNLFNILYIRI